MSTTPFTDDAGLIQALNTLRDVPERTQQSVASGRTAFMAEAATLAMAGQQHAGSSLTAQPKRFGHWRATLALLFGLGLGSAGVAFAAQDSLPQTALYPIKLVTEDVRLALTQDPAARIELLERYAQRRRDEISALQRANANASAFEDAQLRLESQLQQRDALVANIAPEPTPVPEPTATAQRIQRTSADAAEAEATATTQPTTTQPATFTMAPTPELIPSATAEPTNSPVPASPVPIEIHPSPPPTQSPLPIRLRTTATAEIRFTPNPTQIVLRETRAALATLLPPAPSSVPRIRSTPNPTRIAVRETLVAIATQLATTTLPPPGDALPPATPPAPTGPIPESTRAAIRETLVAIATQVAQTPAPPPPSVEATAPPPSVEATAPPTPEPPPTVIVIEATRPPERPRRTPSP
jgi:hypothetical protein